MWQGICSFGKESHDYLGKETQDRDINSERGKEEKDQVTTRKT